MTTRSPFAVLTRVTLALLFCLALSSTASAQFQTANSGVTIDFQTFGIYSNNGNFAICSVSARLNNDGRIEVGGCVRSNAPGQITPATYNAQLQVIDGNTGQSLGTASVFSVPLPGFQQDIPFPNRFFTPPSPVGAGANLELIFTFSLTDGNTWVLDSRNKPDGQFTSAPNPRAPGSYNWTVRRYAANNFPTRCGGFSSLPSCPDPSAASFSASPTTINAGDGSTLSWNVPGASQVTISGVGTFGSSGSVVVSPGGTTTYTLSGQGAQDCAPVVLQATVNVNACQSISSFSATATTINAGQSTTLNYSLAGASSATITDLTSGQVFNVPVQSGSLVVTPPDTRTYRLSAFGACGTVTQDIQINVNQPPNIWTFFVNPNSICAGSTTTLGWDTGNASAVSITDLATGQVFSGLGTSGTLDVTPPSSRTYRLTASNGAGSTTQDVALTVNPLAAINGFSASATTINAGQSVNLNFSVSNTSARSITDLATGAVTTLGVESGAATFTPASTRTYRLTASNGCNTVTQDVTINVIQPPTISTFSADAGSVCAGGAVTLSWSASGGTSATVSAPGLPGSPVSVNPAGGSLVVNPNSSTTYTLTVSNSAGSDTRTVTVGVTPAPSIGSFSASVTTINAGQSTTLNFSSSNGSSASITDLATGAVTAVPVNGSLVVTPPSSRSYRFTVSGTCGTVTQDVAITVIQPPTISSFTASATSICAGNSTTLSWASSGATSASITDLTSGAVTPVAVNGTLAVAPPSSRTYRLTVSNSAGSVTSDLPISVTPLAVINTFSASATTINAGQSTTLTFNVSNTSSRSITDLSTGTVTTLGVESGTQVVTPPTTRTYRLTATSGCNTVTQDVTINVTGPPAISAFTASASPVCSGGASTLSWTASGGTSATVSAAGLPGSPVAVNPNSGSLVVNPTSTTTYTLTVTNGAGSVTRTATVTVTPAPAIATYSASATTINAGQSTTLTWTSSNGTTASITDLSTSTVTSVPVNGSLVVTPATTRAYRLTINGSCGTVTQDITITVNQAPTISAFAASASPVCSGAASTLSWTASGGTSASISAPGLPGSPVAVNPNSGTLVVNPSATTTYTLTVTNAVGSTTRTVTVNVTPAPAVSTFTASPSTVVQGSSSTLSWTSTDGTSATVTDLTSGTVTNVAVNGSLAVAPASTRQYRLTINGSCGTVTQTLTVTVTPCQTISTFTASATTITVGQSTTLSYTLTGATTASITDLATGTVTNVAVQSGTLVVTPNSTRTYRLTANGPCATITRDLVINVNALPGVPMVGPQGQPLASGPTDSNDDYTNMTATAGVAVPFGGTTTAGGVVTFNNTAFNNSTSAENMTLTARSIPTGFIVDCSVDGGATWTSLNTSSVTGVAGAGVSYALLIRVTYPAGLNVLTAYPVVLRLANVNNPASFNETIDRLYTGFVRADKSQIITNATGVGSATDPVSGATIEYVLTYTNVTATGGTGNTDLSATNIIITEDGNASPNTWGTTTTHVAGSASDTRGGTITGDTAGSSVLKDTVPSLAPGQSGTFRFKRRIK